MNHLRSFNESSDDPNIILDIEDILLDLSDMGYFTQVDVNSTLPVRKGSKSLNDHIIVDMANIIGKYGVVVSKFLSDTEETYIRIIEYMKLKGYGKIPNYNILCVRPVKDNRGEDLYRGVMRARNFPSYLTKRRSEWIGNGIRYNDGTNSRESEDFITSESEMTVLLKEMTFAK